MFQDLDQRHYGSGSLTVLPIYMAEVGQTGGDG